MSLTPARLQNLLIYVLTAMANILAIALAAALAAGTMPGFRDGEMLAPAKTEMAALLAFVIPILSGLVAANRPSLGGEGLAAQASVLRQKGYHRDDMVVLSPDDAVAAIAGDGQAGAAFTPVQVQQLTDELIRRRDQQPPAPADPLPPNPRYPSPPTERG
jgi:hypothetical protein